MSRKITSAFMAITLLGACCAECSADLLKGVIKEVDIEVGTITIFVGGKGADSKIVKGKVANGGGLNDQPQVLNLKSPNIPVLLSDGKKTKLSELKPGVPVTLKLSDDEDVEAIVAGFAVRSGTLLAVDLTKKLLTVQGGKKNPETTTFALAAETTVTVNGRKKTPAHLNVGQHVLLLLSLDQKSAVSIFALLKVASDDPRGVIVGVDAAQHTITLLVGREGKFRFATWPVADDFQFVFNEVERPSTKLSTLPVASKLTDLVQAAPVWLRLDQEQKTVAAIVAEPAFVQAVIEAVDVGKRTLVARVGDGKPETFLLEQDADIRVGSKIAELQSFQPGMSAQLTLALAPGRLLGIRTKK